MADSVGQPSYQSLPQGTYLTGTPGTEFAGVAAADTSVGEVAPSANTLELTPKTSFGYSARWSVNPGIFNTETSNPGFVEHDHGHP